VIKLGMEEFGVWLRQCLAMQWGMVGKKSKGELVKVDREW